MRIIPVLGRGGSHRSEESQFPDPGSPNGNGERLDRVGWLRFSEEAFQRGTPCGAASPHVSGPGNRATEPASSIRPAPVPSHCPVRASRRPVRALNPSPTPDGFRRLVSRRPLPDYEPGMRGGTPRSIPFTALKAISRFSYPSPASLIAVVDLAWGPRLILRGCSVRPGHHVLAKPPGLPGISTPRVSSPVGPGHFRHG